MSQPTKGEFEKLRESVATIDKSLDVARDRLSSLKERFEKGETDSEKLRDQISDLRTQLQVLHANFEDFKRRGEESERRRWTVYGVMLAAALTFIANLVLLLLRK